MKAGCSACGLSELGKKMKAISQETAKHILALGFLLVILLFVSSDIISLREVQTVGKLTQMIYDHPLVVSNASLNAGINMTKMHRSMKDVALSNSLNELDKAYTVTRLGPMGAVSCVVAAVI